MTRTAPVNTATTYLRAIAFVALIGGIALLLSACGDGTRTQTSFTPLGDGTVMLHTVHASDTTGGATRLFIESRAYTPGVSAFAVYECTPVDTTGN